MHALLLATYSEETGPKPLLCCTEKADGVEDRLVWFRTTVVEDDDDVSSPAMSHSQWRQTRHSTASAPTGSKTYVSSPSVPPPAASIVKHICLRALSAEAIQGREGKMVFGSSDKEFTFAYIFQVLDWEARGLHRTLALIYVRKDINNLMAHANFMEAALRDVATGIKKLSKQRFQRESRKRRLTDLAQAADHPGEEPSELRRLSEVASHKNLMRDVHSRLAWCLHTASTRLLLKKSPPLFRVAGFATPAPPGLNGREPDGKEPTFDASASSYEYRTPLSGSRPLAVSVGLTESHASSASDEDEREASMRPSAKGSPAGVAERGANRQGSDTPRTDATGDDEVGAGPPPAAAALGHSDIRKALLKGPCGALPPGCVAPAEAFRLLVFHLASGDQVVVTSPDASVAAQAAGLLAQLLPEPLRRVVPFSKSYVPSYQCNVIGMLKKSFKKAFASDGLPDGSLHLAFGRKKPECGNMPSRAVLSVNCSRWRGLKKSVALCCFATEVDAVASGAKLGELEELLVRRIRDKYARLACLFVAYARHTRKLRDGDLTESDKKKFLAVLSVPTQHPPADAAVFRFLGSAKPSREHVAPPFTQPDSQSARA
ncbi:hypothetical protein DIPPA_02906 [Diplonema papillatum]|nr:hypothetical protein DIPPA_02906 [Diplonema papillatum]